MDRDKMLDVTLQQIEKQFGKGAVMKLGEHPMNAGISSSPRARSRSTSRWASAASRAAGSSRSSGPRARARPRSACTSSPRPSAQGGIAAFIDAEHALDPTYARELGVNIDELLVSQPDSGEQALEIADMLVRSGALDSS